jgi:hypothetical protein
MSMIDRIVQEWRTRGIGVLIVGGQVMLASGLPEQTKDLEEFTSLPACNRSPQRELE